MSNPSLDPKLQGKIHELLKTGRSHDEITAELRSQGFKISQTTVSKYSHLAPPLLPSNKKTGDFNWREWTPWIKQGQDLKHKGSFTQDHAEITLGDGKRPIAIAPFSDMHMGAWSSDHEALTRFTDELLKTPDLYIGLLGDYGQYAIKLRGVLEVSDNLLPPEQQTDFIDSWLNEIWHKVAFATWDNHGIERQEKQAGESGLKRIFSRKVIYFNGIGHMDIHVGEQTYRGVVTHKFRGRSLLNPVHGQMRYMRFEGNDRDFAMSGDSHVPGMAKYTDGPKVRV